jgi:DNA-binding NarL/FixJ family response regulator
MSTGRPIRLLVADDHPALLEGLCTVLTLNDPELEIVATATNGKDAVAAAARSDPDVILMDIKMPEMSGVEAARAMRKERPDLKILMLTTFDDRELIADAMAAGAKGYILKDTPLLEIIDAIKAVHHGQVLMSERVAAKLDWTAKSEAEATGPTPPEIEELSNREREILRLIAGGRNNRQIAEELFISEKTVRNYVSRIYEVLGLHNRTRVALWARERGIV